MFLVAQPVGSITLTFIGSTCSHLCGTWLLCPVSDLMDDIVMRWQVSATKCLCLEVVGQMRYLALQLILCFAGLFI